MINGLINLDAWIQNFLLEKGMGIEMAHYILLSFDLLLLLVICVIANWISKRIIVKGIQSFIKKTKNDWDDIFLDQQVFQSLSALVPLIIIKYLAEPVFSNFQVLIPIVSIAVKVLIVMVIISVISKTLKAIEEVSQRIVYFKDKPLGSYVQLVRIIVFVIAAILISSVLLGKDPMTLLGALGALTAVIMLVFKDTILGLVASIQLSSNDMVRVGDWVSMPKYGADGDVIGISLNTVKIQNWDKTISTIPTYSFIADSFQNWRGMSDAKGRRIKRSLNIDMTSVKFCTEERLEYYKKYELLRGYIESKQSEINGHNDAHSHDKSCLINGRNL
ncbi:MAG: mechanosensitive ion channel, partial [Flavobacteriales bacterium]|nr:mechanosensitive ion channel [Flavobacteriales bacterium]